jgi:hypothetical protein
VVFPLSISIRGQANTEAGNTSMTLDARPQPVTLSEAIASAYRALPNSSLWRWVGIVGLFLRLFFLSFPISIFLLWIQEAVGDVLDEPYDSINDLSVILGSMHTLAGVLKVFLEASQLWLVATINANSFEWFWPICVSALVSLALIVFERRFTRFLLVALSWAAACIISDAICGRISSPMYFFHPLCLTFAIAILLAWLFRWPLSSVRLTLNGAHGRQPDIQLREKLLLKDYYTPGELRINLWFMLTGFCSIMVGIGYYMLLMVIIGELAIFSSDALLMPVLMFLDIGVIATLFLGLFGPLILYPLLITSIVFNVIYFGRLIRKHMKQVLLWYRVKCAWGYFLFFSFVLLIGNLSVFYFRIRGDPGLHPKLVQISSNVNYLLIELTGGFLIAATMPVLATIGPAWVRRTWSKTGQVKVDAAALRLLQSEVPGLPIWAKAIAHPVGTVQKFISINGQWEQFEKFRALTASSFAVSIAAVGVGAVVSGVSLPDAFKGTLGRSLAFAFIMVGGLAYHIILRMFRLPSKLLTTLLLYAVPQALCMPILAALSFPSISLEHKLLDGIRGQEMDTFNALTKLITMLPSAANQPGWSYATIAMLSGIVTSVLVISFLELYWQQYRVPRIKVYSAFGMTIWFVSTVLILLPIPIHVIVLRWLGL